MGKLVSWYWQLRYLVRYVNEDEYQSISSSPGKERKESAGRKGGRRKTRKRRKKKRKTTKRKKQSDLDSEKQEQPTENL